MLRVALFCDESAGARTLSTVTRSEHELVAILTSPPGSSRGHAGVWRTAEKLGYEPIPARTAPRNRSSPASSRGSRSTSS